MGLDLGPWEGLLPGTPTYTFTVRLVQIRVSSISLSSQVHFKTPLDNSLRIGPRNLTDTSLVSLYFSLNLIFTLFLIFPNESHSHKVVQTRNPEVIFIIAPRLHIHSGTRYCYFFHPDISEFLFVCSLCPFPVA